MEQTTMHTTPFEPTTLQVLLVDDTPANIDVLTQTLEPEGYRLLVANNGEKALKIAARVNPDLVLLDVMMPGIDGFETCRQLKADANTRDIPVIFCTAKTEVSDLITGFESGGVDYITKPYRHAEVLARVRTHLQLRRSLTLLSQRNTELNTLNQTKNKFLGIAAHDLRNPIGAVLCFAEMLREDYETLSKAEIIDGLNCIVEASDIMLNLVNDLLDVSAIEQGNLNLRCQPGSLRKLVVQRLELCRFRAQQKNICLETALAELPEYCFDNARLGQVFDNLIGNAIKFAPPATTVWVSIGLEEGAPCFSVRDQGPGLSATDLEKLFKDFQQLSAKPTGGEKSTGLGLAIVKKIVDAHQGTIRVHNHPSGGAVFSVLLPVQAA
jgi:two-component system, sensor histidine kinase and response regulator